MRNWGFICLIAAAVALAGCGGGSNSPAAGVTHTAPSAVSAPHQGAVPASDPGPPPQGPRWPADPKYQQCGQEINLHGVGYDAKSRECLWQGYHAGKPTEFTTTAYTTEGDPITSAVRVVSGTDVRVLVDSHDGFGTPGQFTYGCKSMERIEQTYSSGQRYSFSLKGCTGTGDAKEIGF